MTHAMSRVPRVLVLMAGLTLAGASPARAQAGPPPLEGRTFVNVSVGMQVQSRSITAVHPFDLFEGGTKLKVVEVVKRVDRQNQVEGTVAVGESRRRSAL